MYAIIKHSKDGWWRYGVTKVVWLRDQCHYRSWGTCVPPEIIIPLQYSGNYLQIERRTRKNGPEMVEIGYPVLLTQEEHIPYLLNGWSNSHEKACVL